MIKKITLGIVLVLAMQSLAFAGDQGSSTSEPPASAYGDQGSSTSEPPALAGDQGSSTSEPPASSQSMLIELVSRLFGDSSDHIN